MTGIEVTTFEHMLLLTVIPAVFVYLWTLIFGDFRNFASSRKAYSIYTAEDPVNCYKNFTDNKIPQ